MKWISLLLAALVSSCALEDPGPSVADDSDAVTAPTLSVTFVDRGHRILAMDRSGTLYATAYADNHATIQISTDGRRWQVRAKRPGSGTPSIMSVLSNGTLLLETKGSTGQTLWRSTDRGLTWKAVLNLGTKYRLLETHSIAELGGRVFLGEYQSVTSSATTIRLWTSGDLGATWSVRATFTTFRHIHSLLADPATTTLWLFAGDQTGGLWRSTDKGFTWRRVLASPSGQGVEGVIANGGVLYGRDTWWTTSPVAAIVNVKTDGTSTFLKTLPEPSSSILRLANGQGYLCALTHEPAGPYAGVLDAFVYSSGDGVTWRQATSWDVDDPDDYGRADVHWQLPSGEVVVELANVIDMPVRGGYELVKVTNP